MSTTPGGAFDDMGGEFEARLRRTTVQTRTSKSEGRELTVSNPLSIVEARFSYKVLDRLNFPSFIAIERRIDGSTRYVVHEVIGVSPTHYQLPGVDSSMPTLLRKEYLDTINESWGKSQETWIDLAAIPTSYVAAIEGNKLEFYRAPHVPLPGSRAYLLSKSAVESFLCEASGEKIGKMAGFDLPFTVNMENLIRYHCGFFAFSLDYSEPIIYRAGGLIKVGKIGELVDSFFEGEEDGRVYTSSLEAVSFDPKTLETKWSPVQYVFRHRNSEKMLRFVTRAGRTVTVTPGHSLFVLRNGRVECLSSAVLRPGDFLVGSSQIPLTDSKKISFDLAAISKENGDEGIYVLGLEPEIFDSIEASIPKWKRWYWRQKRKIPLRYWERKGETREANIHLSYKGCGNPVPIRLEVDQDLARLLGYYAAEGHLGIRPGNEYSVHFTLGKNDSQIIKDIQRILTSKFGIRPKVSKHGENAIRVSFNHRILALLLSASVGKGAKNKRVPREILNSSLEVRRAFLSAWALGDHCVTTSYGLMNDVMYLFLLEGITASVSRWAGEGETTIEGRRVNASPRYQLWFPRPREVIENTVRSQRGRAEPIYPAIELPAALRSLLLHPSHVRSSKLKVRGRLLEEVEKRLAKLVSYPGNPSMTVKEARHDGVYRRGFEKYLIRNGSSVAATQLLMDASQDFEATKPILASNLAFYEIISVEEVDATSRFVYDVSVPGAENFLAGFGGLFCHNTGSGKSNLTSTLIRKARKRDPGLTIVVLDIAGEYAVSLLDILDENSKLISSERMDSEEEFFSSQAIPESIEAVVGRENLEKALAKAFRRGVEWLSLQEAGGLDLGWIQQLLQGTVDGGKTGATAAKVHLGTFTTEFYEKRGLRQSSKLSDLDDGARAQLISLLTELQEGVHGMSGLRMDIQLILDQLSSGNFGSTATNRLTPEKLAEQLARGTAAKLNILYLPDPLQARIAANRLITRLLFLKKKFGNKERVLFVLDEAQEYIPDNPTDRQFTVQSNQAVEQLLRQGRKYRLHCWLATQRVAHLNVNALQQLHSYFVSTLPRMYDRMVIADAFALPYEVLERSAQLETGEWIFVSFKAAKQRNVPVFLSTENNETYVSDYLKK